MTQPGEPETASKDPTPPRSVEDPATSPPPSPADAVSDPGLIPDDSIAQKLEEIYGLLTVRRGAEVADLMKFLQSKRHLAWTNFVLGMARGVGFFLGVSLVGALVVAVAGYFVDFTARTFRSNYDTQTLVRSVMNKYAEVMDEVDRVRTVQGDEMVRLPSATGAQVGAVFLLAARAQGSSTAETDPGGE